MSTSATFWSRPLASSVGAISSYAACVAYDSTSITSGFRPAVSATAVRDALDGARYEWGAGGNYVLLGPGRMAHVLEVER